ncbi:MAG: D-aminoacyl-tRNA deacylase [Lachnospiraceae bacterium]|nr:D-aminoacyl-tRNA deacylase [Lachnospiraceae bacterium]
MRFVIQVVKNAQVVSDGELTGKISRGYAVLIGIGKDDTEEIADKMVDKMLKLRINADENGKTNLALKDVDGSLLLVSQFTLYADYHHGNRPNFLQAAGPQLAVPLYERIISRCRDAGYEVQTGVFGADMQLTLTNDGPFTIVLDSDEL